MKSFKESKAKEAWLRTIQDWRKSGLNIAEWCRQHRINYHQFHYWKQRLDDLPFIELIEPSSDEAGISLNIREVVVHLNKQFDILTLEKVIEVLRRV